MPKQLSEFKPGDTVYVKGILGERTAHGTVVLTEVAGVGSTGTWHVPNSAYLHDARTVETWQKKAKHWDLLQALVLRAQEQITRLADPRREAAKNWLRDRVAGLLKIAAGTDDRLVAFDQIAETMQEND